MTDNNHPAAPPEILVDVYGNRAPDAAKFGVGASDRAAIEQATDARRNARPGECERR